MDAQLAGTTCDEDVRDAKVAAANQVAQQQVEAACSVSQLQQLRFNTLDEAKSDVSRACGDQVDAAVSLLYGPAVNTGAVAGGNSDMESCLSQTAKLSNKLLHFSLRVRRQALDRLASHPFAPSQRIALVARAAERIAAARQKIATLIEQSCPSFAQTYQSSMSNFLGLLEPRSDCIVGYGYVQGAVTCPVPICGNGVKETGEQCDDGNSVDNDLCHNNCTKNDCSVFPTTYALIQQAIFEQHGCTQDLCHGSSKQGNMDLRDGASYHDLVKVVATIDPSLNRVEPGDSARSLLWLKLAASTLARSGVKGSPMPLGLPALSANELEAVRLWIHAAAPETGVVGGVADLLDACALPADPIQIQPPDPPAPGTGVQLRMPQWELPPHSENEVCFASYYDLSNDVPMQFRGAGGNTFRFHRQNIVQDPQSHHLIVNLYQGTASIDDPDWGPFTCKGGTLNGQPCDPKVSTSCGSEGLCGSEPTTSVACIGFGPPDSQTGAGGFAGFTGTQQTAYEQTFADGVYEEIPLKGIIIWNSHAFNLTRKSADQRAWLNFNFAVPQNQLYPVRGIFNASEIFVQDVPPFQSHEYCNDHVLDRGTRLFQISSHMHKRGKRFTIFAPNGSLMYTSTVYNDPVQLYYDPPLAFDDADVKTRTLRYCALYDNGATDPTEVKRKSTSPPTPNGFPFGGPCQIPSGCVSGKVGQSCSGSNQTKRDASCDSESGKGDGLCDACTLKGGVTTEDEMFILLGTFYLK